MAFFIVAFGLTGVGLTGLIAEKMPGPDGLKSFVALVLCMPLAFGCAYVGVLAWRILTRS